jgi:5'/3'-nucleotidase
MKILVTNDDGLQAEGIQTLSAAMEQLADVILMAPDRDRSGASNSLTLRAPLRVIEHAPNKFAVQGTPTDCVHMAMTGFLEELPDMVISGINHGANLGDDILYSGTVAAAMEGRYLGLPAIAISLVGERGQHMATAAYVAKQIVTRLKDEPLPARTILNVNVPDCPINELKGFEVCRLGARHVAEPTVHSEDPRGRSIYWIGPPGPEQDAGNGTDFWAVRNGRVAITPLQLDMTHYKFFDQLSQWMTDL